MRARPQGERCNLIIETSERTTSCDGKDANGVATRGTPEQGDALPMEFRLYEASGNLLSRDVVATLTRIGGTALSR